MVKLIANGHYTLTTLSRYFAYGSVKHILLYNDILCNERYLKQIFPQEVEKFCFVLIHGSD